jgi:hypothetical protein
LNRKGTSGMDSGQHSLKCQNPALLYWIHSGIHPTPGRLYDGFQIRGQSKCLAVLEDLKYMSWSRLLVAKPGGTCAITLTTKALANCSQPGRKKYRERLWQADCLHQSFPLCSCCRFPVRPPLGTNPGTCSTPTSRHSIPRNTSTTALYLPEQPRPR